MVTIHTSELLISFAAIAVIFFCGGFGCGIEHEYKLLKPRIDAILARREAKKKKKPNGKTPAAKG